MWTLRGGLRGLVEALRDHLKCPPILGANVRKLAKESEPDSAATGWYTAMVRIAGPRTPWCWPVPPMPRPRCWPTWILRMAEHIAQIPYNRLAVIAMGYRRQDVPMSVDGFGFIAPQRTRRDLLGVQWCSSIFPGRAPDGAVLLRAMCGVTSAPRDPTCSTGTMNV